MSTLASTPKSSNSPMASVWLWFTRTVLCFIVSGVVLPFEVIPLT